MIVTAVIDTDDRATNPGPQVAAANIHRQMFDTAAN